jgi:hypothetical protein
MLWVESLTLYTQTSVMIGLKSDLRKNPGHVDRRVVTFEEAQKFAKKINARYCEVSTKNSENLLEPFRLGMEELVRISNYNVNTKPSKNCTLQ